MNPAGVHVLSLDLSEVPEAAWPALLHLLDGGERARAAQFMHESDRQSYTAAHALLRHLLSALCDTPPDAWRFTTRPDGKPAVAGLPDLHFNLSHTRGMVVVCAAYGIEVGADVEGVSPDRLHLDIADRFFAPAEAAWLRALPNEAAIRNSFTILWTLKEAFVKAIGVGLARKLDSFVFESINPVRLSFPDPALGDAGRWRFWRAARGRHRLAVAYALPGDRGGAARAKVRHGLASVRVPADNFAAAFDVTDGEPGL